MEEKGLILFAEDDEICARSMEDLLEGDGWRVEIACDGEMALMNFLETRPDMLVVDLDLPKMNGWEVIRAIRKRDNSIPVVVYSGVSVSRDLIRALDEGATDVIRKGEDPDLFLAKLNMIYNRVVVMHKDPHLYVLSCKTRFNGENYVLTIGNKRMDLNGMKGKLMKLLCMKFGALAEKEFLIAGLWKHSCLGKDIQLRKYISQLRGCIIEDEDLEILGNRDGYRFQNKRND